MTTGNAKRYKWDKRRDKKAARTKFHLGTFDFVMVTLIFTLYFLSLRLFFIYHVVSLPCAELWATAGQIDGNLPIFKLTYYIALTMGLFWVCVTLDRVLKILDRRTRIKWGLIIWHIIMFVCILFLVVFNRSLVASDDIAPPDGSIIAEAQAFGAEPDWTDYEDGIWYARGMPACVWLDRNEITSYDSMKPGSPLSTLDRLGLGRPYIDILIARQSYRPLTEDERERFLEKQACQADIMLYGQRTDTCQSRDYEYPVPEGVEPPDYIKDYYIPERLIHD